MKALQYKRKRKKNTDYRKRLALLKSGVPRFVVRKGNGSIVAQIVEYSNNGDRVVVTSTSSHIKKQGWKFNGSNLPAAYLIGLNCGILGMKKGIKKCILDARNITTRKGSSTYSAAKGLIDSGINLNCREEVFPAEERILGKHIEAYLKSAEGITKNFEDLRKK